MQKVRFKSYKKVDIYKDKKLYNTLKKMTFVNGTLRPALNGRQVKKAVVAYKKDKVIGWCGVYNDESYGYGCNVQYNNMGVWVKKEFRHNGIGRKLLYKACKGFKSYHWFDSRTHSWHNGKNPPQKRLNQKVKKDSWW